MKFTKENYQKLIDLFFDSGYFGPLEYFPLNKPEFLVSEGFGSSHCLIVKNHNIKIFIHKFHSNLILEWRKELMESIKFDKKYPYRWSIKLEFEELEKYLSNQVYEFLLFNLDFFIELNNLD